MLKLLLPLIFPSWRFFSSIGPSPRVQYALLAQANTEPQWWCDFRSIPQKTDTATSFLRLFYNPRWNETLYIHSCAEHLFDEPSEWHQQEIQRRLVAAIRCGEIPIRENEHFIVFRINAKMRDGDEIVQPVVFISAPILIRNVSL